MNNFKDFLNEKKGLDIGTLIDNVEDEIDYNLGATESDFVVSEVIYTIDVTEVFIGSSDAEYTEKDLVKAFEKNKGVKVELIDFESYMNEDEAYIDLKMTLRVAK